MSRVCNVVDQGKPDGAAGRLGHSREGSVEGGRGGLIAQMSWPDSGSNAADICLMLHCLQG